ncbi:hypothetical protein ACRE_047650 [Hapsidospora chrysogenum ATCC 11550]|uniref:Acetylserotonin methytransferase-like protein n=1 Tax=Hapsidospora chrysogenum (strain ATCC 11550 / CBS 779.69 / DSM 880 / IAM 14645 / JCM 23072 / IMI 49137) TaxID=857340 RepID=A0A086T523_HAPC1|nr:hypothetical protein ACRE_047650 [Hapsidospora chrysogenum ATCC 11550]
MPSSSPAPGSFSLFPSPNVSKPPPVGRNQTPLGRRSESRERRAPTPQSVRAQTPQHGAEPEHAASPPRQGRSQTQHRRQQTPLLFDSPQQQQQDAQQRWPLGGQGEPQPQEQAQQRQETPPRTDTVAPVATQERPIRSSIAKLPLDDGPESSNPQPLRSIFPTYNPDLPLDQQDYAPTQKSPSRIPRTVLSRQSYHQRDGDSTHIRSPAHSPRGNEEAPHRWARPKPQEPPVIPKPTTTEHLKNFWKVANGWRAPSSEGRVYCMKLSQEKDAPVYTLSSATDPFYNIRLDPTSASARVTVMRHDPNKPFKEPRREAGSSSSSLIGGSNSSESTSTSKITDGKDWHEALTTTLEEESRRHQPEDGLVALLMPTAATKVALERANNPQAVEMAERECARLVWDDDSDNYFLVHPALATPFCVTIERSPAWSRVEYTLEHHESPLHLAKLTRDATGGGWLELDTGLASKIESFYIADVAVTALVLVASADEKNQPTAAEAFEPPPMVMPPAAVLCKAGSHHERAKSSLGKLVGGKKKPKMEAFEIDLESQDDSLGKGAKVKVKEGIDTLPFILRVPAKIARALFKMVIWFLTVAFKCLRVVFGSCYKCVGSKY